MTNHTNRRVLLVDDNPEIHRDFRAILAPERADERGLDAAESALFGAVAPSAPASTAADFEVESADGGEAAVVKTKEALAAKRPFAMAFVDMRMPPGWDGVETIEHLWQVDPKLQVVVCTAFADYSWSEMVARLGATDRLLILKKPFDAIEVCQLATALTAKWTVTERERAHLGEVQRAEQEARAYAASLETVNRALEAARATTEAELESRQRLFLHVASELAGDASHMERTRSEALAREPEQAGWLQAVESLCSEAGEIAASIDIVREHAELDAGVLAAQLAPCSPRDVAEQALGAARAWANARGVVLTLATDDRLPETVLTDAAWIRRILARVLQIAIGRSTAGSVRLSASSHDRGLDDSHLRFEVSSDGERTSPQTLAELFDPMPGQSGAASQRVPRPLLGLSVCRRLAQRLGGQLVVEATPGGGPRWVLTIPNRERVAG